MTTIGTVAEQSLKCEVGSRQDALASKHESVFLSVSELASWPFGNHGRSVNHGGFALERMPY
jgi:hypothetical protein